MPFINHAIIHPPVDRNMAPGAPGGPTDIYMRVTKETDAGIRVSGAKVVATGSALTHFTFVAHHGLIPVQDKNFAMVFMVPTNATGVKLICRVSNEQRAAVLGSPFDYPLSSRLDENDAIFVMDDVLVPWEDVFVYADVEKANNFFPRTGFLPRALLHGCTRLAVKLDFITGLLIKATEMTGARGFRGVEANIGEVIAWRNMIWGLSDAMAQDRRSVDRRLRPAGHGAGRRLSGAGARGLRADQEPDREDRGQRADLPQLARARLQGAGAAQVSRPVCARLGRRRRGRAREADEAAVGRGRHASSARRHELYEINYSGSHEEIRRYALFGAIASGQYDRWKGFAEYVHGGIRPRRLDRAGPDQSGRCHGVSLVAFYHVICNNSASVADNRSGHDI